MRRKTKKPPPDERSGFSDDLKREFGGAASLTSVPESHASIDCQSNRKKICPQICPILLSALLGRLWVSLEAKTMFFG